MQSRFAKIAIAGSAGLLFGAGLAVSGMLNPAKVLGFLDVLGDWDPSLAFVMGGALMVTTPVTFFAKRRGRSLVEGKLSLPSSTSIDRRLVGGAVLFGIGWGLAGLCPGPALASVSVAFRETWVFVLALVAGSVLHRVVERTPSK